MPKCILIVDDDALNVQLVKHTLQSTGHELLTAQDGQDALETLKKRIPDLILLDVHMPKMDGYTFIMEKSKVPAFASIPVIVLTSAKETAPMFKRHGVKAYLIKPLDPQDLLNKIQIVFST